MVTGNGCWPMNEGEKTKEMDVREKVEYYCNVLVEMVWAQVECVMCKRSDFVMALGVAVKKKRKWALVSDLSLLPSLTTKENKQKLVSSWCCRTRKSMHHFIPLSTCSSVEPIR